MPDYTIVCKNGHQVSLTPTEMEQFLYEGDFSCSKCRQRLELDCSLSLVCHICDQPWDVSTLGEAHLAISDTCRHCDEFTEDAYYHVPGSHHEDVAEYDWTREGARESELRRTGRDDYWEGLIHFCTREEFIAIFKTREIRANPTGYFGLPAVCLTETPASQCAELKKSHGDYGYVFRKSQLIAAGANPVLYLRTPLIRVLTNSDGLVAQLGPFVNLLRIKQTDPAAKRYDFLHEREWRVAHGIRLDQTVPFGVLLPAGPSAWKFGGTDGDVILAAAQRFQELG